MPNHERVKGGVGNGPARSGRRAPGVVLAALVAAGVEQARAGGPDAVVLREATRAVGVSPTAAYRHFADRDDLLGAVAGEAMAVLAGRMEERIGQVASRPRTMTWARGRLAAVGHAYLEFARDEPGLFRTAFAAPPGAHAARAATAAPGTSGRLPLEILDDVLDDLVATGVLPRARRGLATTAAWSTVHGLAMLRLAGAMPDEEAPAALDDALGRFIQRGL